jgi:uncharacterized protein (DUF305 family)
MPVPTPNASMRYIPSHRESMPSIAGAKPGEPLFSVRATHTSRNIQRMRTSILLRCLATVTIAMAGATPRLAAQAPVYTHADVDLVRGVIAHHAQALTIEAMAPAHGASPRVQLFAAELEITQREKVQALQAWLKERGQAVPVVADGHADHDHGVTGSGAAEHAHMAGMLTEDQMEELAHARGVRFERLFLTYMIQHHQGAVTSLETLTGVSPDVAALASGLVVEEKGLIMRMQAMAAP